MLCIFSDYTTKRTARIVTVHLVCAPNHHNIFHPPPHHRIQEERGAERLKRGERKRKTTVTVLASVIVFV